MKTEFISTDLLVSMTGVCSGMGRKLVYTLFRVKFRLKSGQRWIIDRYVGLGTLIRVIPVTYSPSQQIRPGTCQLNNGQSLISSIKGKTIRLLIWSLIFRIQPGPVEIVIFVQSQSRMIYLKNQSATLENVIISQSLSQAVHIRTVQDRKEQTCPE